MTGRAYLEAIKDQLLNGRHQHKMGESILDAFGYVRRRRTAIDEINEELKALGLRTDPLLTVDMPLRVPRIRFLLTDGVPSKVDMPAVNAVTAASIAEGEVIKEEDAVEEIVEQTFVSSFKVAELEAAEKEVVCISPNDTIFKAYTVMSLRKYSQLVVADGSRPQATAIKGIISYQSIANASLHGSPQFIRDCLDSATPHVDVEDDISLVIDHLIDNDVVLVVGRDKRLSGIITAWDLAAEFEKLIGPFKWIGEIELRLRQCLITRLGKAEIVSFLNRDADLVGADAEQLTLGNLVRVFENSDMWGKLRLPFDRVIFTHALDEIREMRNRLMHFRDELKEEEIERLRSFCQTVRRISLSS